MIEKTIVTVLKALSAVFYVIILLAILSIPVIFIYEAFQPPVFALEDISISDADKNDKFLISEGESHESWTKIDYSLKASSGKFSPYSYKIDEFMLVEEPFGENPPEYKIALQEEIEFSGTEDAEFTLSLYIKDNNDENIEDILNDISFKAKSYEKSFSEFSVTYEEEVEEKEQK